MWVCPVYLAGTCVGTVEAQTPPHSRSAPIAAHSKLVKRCNKEEDARNGVVDPANGDGKQRIFGRRLQ